MTRKTKQMLEKELQALKWELTNKEYELESLKEKLNEVKLEKEYWFIESEIFSLHLNNENSSKKVAMSTIEKDVIKL